MPKTEISILPELDLEQLRQVIDTLTKQRLDRYLRAMNGQEQQALELYVLNTRISAAFLTDLHYVEIALRNKFDEELAIEFGACWFTAAPFLNMIDQRSQGILQKAQKDVSKHWHRKFAVPPGKVIAELSFGFWLNLTDPKLEHVLWVPYLYKAFQPRKAPKRATFNQQLEKLRQLRNRVAHHEPIFHMDLLGIHMVLNEVMEMLSPPINLIMNTTSTVRREIQAIVECCKQ